MIHFEQEPPFFNWSKNPIMFRFVSDLDSTDEQEFIYALLVSDIREPSGWRTFYMGKKQFSGAEYVHLDVSDKIDAELSYQIIYPWQTTAGLGLIKAPEQSKKFKLQFSQATSEEDVFTESAEFFVVKGGVAVEQFNPFSIYQKHFLEYVLALDYRGDFITLYRQQLFYFSFLVTHSNYAKLSINITNEHNPPSSFEYDLTGYSLGDVLLLNPFAGLDFSDAASCIISIKSTSNILLYSRIISFKKQIPAKAKQVAFVNSIGGTEVAVFGFNDNLEANYTRENADLYTDASFPAQNFVPLAHSQRVQLNAWETKSRSIDTGRLTYDEENQLRQLALSSDVWLVERNFAPSGELNHLRYVRQNVVMKKALLFGDKNKTAFPFTVELEDAYDNSSFTKTQSICFDNPSKNGLNPPLLGYVGFLFSGSPAAVDAVTLNNERKALSAYPGNTLVDTVDIIVEGPSAEKASLRVGYYCGNSIDLLSSNNPRLIKITGEIPPFCITVAITNAAALSALPKLPFGLQYLAVTGSPLHKVPELPKSLIAANFSSCQLSDISDWNINGIPLGVTNLRLGNNNLSTAQVNFILQALDANLQLNGTLEIENQTPPAAPDAAGLTAKTNLIAKGWTVTTD